VLYVLKRFPRLSETFVLRELLCLEARGQPVLIDALLPPESGPRHPELDRLRAPVRYLPRRPRLRDAPVARAHALLALAAPARWLRLALAARREGTWRRFLQAGLVARRIREERVAHVHAHFATAAAEVARDAAALAGVSFTVTAHAKDIFRRDNARALPRRVRGAATLITVSRFNERYLRAALPRMAVRHVPNGIAVAPRAALPPDGPVLCVARLVPKKGIDVLLEAEALLAPDFPRLRLEVIGSGERAAELAGHASRLGLADRVSWVGAAPSTRVQHALGRCSLFVLPARTLPDGDRDAMPTALLEAMARGVAVVSTDVGGISEVVRHEQTGLLVAPNDPRALAEAVARLLTDRRLAAQLGAGARALIARGFDPSRSARELLTVFAGGGS
jgi:glycosyltransferase involved in cell wall biosynthesis